MKKASLSIALVGLLIGQSTITARPAPQPDAPTSTWLSWFKSLRAPKQADARRVLEYVKSNARCFYKGKNCSKAKRRRLRALVALAAAATGAGLITYRLNKFYQELYQELMEHGTEAPRPPAGPFVKPGHGITDGSKPSFLRPDYITSGYYRDQDGNFIIATYVQLYDGHQRVTIETPSEIMSHRKDLLSRNKVSVRRWNEMQVTKVNNILFDKSGRPIVLGATVRIRSHFFEHTVVDIDVASDTVTVRNRRDEHAEKVQVPKDNISVNNLPDKLPAETFTKSSGKK